jgi:uncharacterized protein
VKILVSGARGLVGSRLVPALEREGHGVCRLVRNTSSSETEVILWNPPRQGPESSALSGIEGVVHLAGDNLAEGRWTEAKKRSIRESRVEATQQLVASFLKAPALPQVVLSASAIGVYGDRGDEILREESAPGSGFLPGVCRGWESAWDPLIAKGVRVVKLRLGVVLDPRGGALEKMLLPFKLGLGGPIGSGRQYWSWVAIDDVVGAFLFALKNEGLAGAVNVVSPEPVTNTIFTQTLGSVLNRPTFFRVPAWAARAALGEMAEAALLSSTRVIPQKLTQAGYRHREPSLEPALRHLLDR